jgi:peptide/nickel transport system substrate-binding protein
VDKKNKTIKAKNISNIFFGIYDYIPKLFHVKRLVFTFLIFLIFLSISFTQSFANIKSYYVFEEPDYGGVLNEALVGQVERLNPIFSSANHVDLEISSLIYSGLTKLGPDRKIVPDLAYNWEVSEDSLEYTFFLRPNIKWHKIDESLTSWDVLFTIKSIQSPDTGSPLEESWRGVEVIVVDDHTIKFKLPSRNNAFLGLTSVGILPSSQLINIPSKSLLFAEFNKNPIGTGPFEFEYLVLKPYGQNVSLIANNNYFPAPAYLDKINFKIFKEKKQILEAYARKDINAFMIETIKDEEEAKKFGSLRFTEVRLPRLMALYFNTENELLKDRDIRNAIISSIDKDSLINSIGVKASKVHYPLLPGQIGYSTEIPKHIYNPEEAEKKLDQLGWVKDEEMREKDSQRLAISLLTTNSQEYVRVAENIKEQLLRVGIEVNIEFVSPLDYQKRLISKNYQAVMAGLNLGIDSDLYPYWHSTQAKDGGFNFAMMKNDKLDKSLEAARQSLDNEIKKNRVIAAQKIIMSEDGVIFLYTPHFIYAQDQRIKNHKPIKMAEPVDRFINISDWYLKSKAIEKN